MGFHYERGERARTPDGCAEDGEMGKLEEALRPAFDLLGLSFPQQFDPEMKPLSFLPPLHEEAFPGDEARVINPTRLHPYLFPFSRCLSLSPSVLFFMRTCASVWLSQSSN